MKLNISKQNNGVSKKLANLIYIYQDIIENIESTMKSCGFSKNKIAKNTDIIKAKEEIRILAEYFNDANNLSIGEAEDTYSLGFFDERKRVLTQFKDAVDRSLAQIISDHGETQQKQA